MPKTSIYFPKVFNEFVEFFLNLQVHCPCRMPNSPSLSYLYHKYDRSRIPLSENVRLWNMIVRGGDFGGNDKLMVEFRRIYFSYRVVRLTYSLA